MSGFQVTFVPVKNYVVNIPHSEIGYEHILEIATQLNIPAKKINNISLDWYEYSLHSYTISIPYDIASKLAIFRARSYVTVVVPTNLFNDYIKWNCKCNIFKISFKGIRRTYNIYPKIDEERVLQDWIKDDTPLQWKLSELDFLDLQTFAYVYNNILYSEKSTDLYNFLLLVNRKKTDIKNILSFEDFNKLTLLLSRIQQGVKFDIFEDITLILKKLKENPERYEECNNLKDIIKVIERDENV